MPRAKPAYPPEFKPQIVDLARSGRSIESLARILHLQGKQEQALKAANKGKEKADDEREKKVIKDLLAVLAQPAQK